MIEDERKGKYLGQVRPDNTSRHGRDKAEDQGAGDQERLERRRGRVRRDGRGHREPAVHRGVQADEAGGRAANTLFIHVTLAPQIEAVGEMKTKPTQHSVQELRRIGIQPDLIIVRGTRALPRDAREKHSSLHERPHRQRDLEPGRRHYLPGPRGSLHEEGVLKPVIEPPRNQGEEDGPHRAGSEVASRFTESKDR